MGKFRGFGLRTPLKDYQGQRILLIFTAPNCGPCDELAPHLVKLHRDTDLVLILVGQGSAEENRRKAKEHGFEFPVVLQSGWKLSKEYGIFITPVAFLINEDGVIAKDVAKGVNEILTLALEASPAKKEVRHGQAAV